MVTMTSLSEAHALCNVSCVHRGFHAQSVGDLWETLTSLLSMGFPWVSLPGPEALLPKGLVVRSQPLESLPPPSGRTLPAAGPAAQSLASNLLGRRCRWSSGGLDGAHQPLYTDEGTEAQSG